MEISADQLSKINRIVIQAQSDIDNIAPQCVILKIDIVNQFSQRDQLKEQGRKIIAAGCDYFHYDIEGGSGFLSDNRRREYSTLRKYLVRYMNNKIPLMTSVLIGEILHRDHATILNCEKTFDNLYKSNFDFRIGFIELDKHLNSLFPELITVIKFK